MKKHKMLISSCDGIDHDIIFQFLKVLNVIKNNMDLNIGIELIFPP
jgi:hypothetical protein